MRRLHKCSERRIHRKYIKNRLDVMGSLCC